MPIASLPIPSREEILNSPVQEHGPLHGATSSFTANAQPTRPPSPVVDDPSEELERELAGTHLEGGMRG
jgi:mitogen-activated protein kinase 7